MEIRESFVSNRILVTRWTKLFVNLYGFFLSSLQQQSRWFGKTELLLYGFSEQRTPNSVCVSCTLDPLSRLLKFSCFRQPLANCCFHAWVSDSPKLLSQIVLHSAYRSDFNFVSSTSWKLLAFFITCLFANSNYFTLALSYKKGSSPGLVAYMLDCDIVRSSHAITFTFGLMPPWERYEPPYGYGLNSATIVLLQGWL